MARNEAVILSVYDFFSDSAQGGIGNAKKGGYML
jgi:hypothetical protein